MVTKYQIFTQYTHILKSYEKMNFWNSLNVNKYPIKKRLIELIVGPAHI